MRSTLAALVGAACLAAGLAGCSPPVPSTPPSGVASASGIASESVTINPGTDWALGGTLTLPTGPPPYPAVVLVQGSGPSDRDETIYQNRPFADIADALTARGIAVLRYDKRTYAYSKQMAADVAGITVEEETIQDAIAAAGLLRADARIDAGRVFVLGHSLGGMLAPRIDAEGGSFAGLIILAGSPRPLSDILIDQVTAQVAYLTGVQKVIGQKQLDALVASLASLETMSDDVARQVTISGASGYYFREMNEHPASDYLAGLTKPVLILQGDADFQISVTKDFGAYQSLLAGRSNVTFTLYPGLNHLFMTSTTGTADEYKTPGHVDAAVLRDIADWILAR